MGIPQIFTLSPLTQDDWEQFGTQTRGRTGMDFTPLVFETSASTDSAIWATFFDCGAKVGSFIETTKCFLNFFERRGAKTF